MQTIFAATMANLIDSQMKALQAIKDTPVTEDNWRGLGIAQGCVRHVLGALLQYSVSAVAVEVQPDPVVVQFPRKGIATHPLQSIADTLEARADAGDPLSPAEAQRLAATLRGLAGGPMDGVVRLPMLGRLVPGSPVCERIV